MESVSDTSWDVVICGTGLQQSLLALALSRSGKKILHVDPNHFYGGAEAAFSLQDAESWANEVSAKDAGLFRSASVARHESAAGLSSRSYSLAMAPTLIHARSALLSQLVSSRAYRQVEFLAVGSFFIFRLPQDSAQQPALIRIPSTREDVFAATTISSKAKRGLMKFLKFVLDYQNPPQLELWQSHAEAPLTEFLQQEFKMDAELQTYIVTLTLSLNGKITTRDGLAVIRRHLSSMGVYGPGFAAIYPKWGGLSEVAQVSCRAAAVGGAVYMLGAGVQAVETAGDEVKLELSSGDTVKTRILVRADDNPSEQTGISRLVAVVGSPLTSMFEVVVEGASRPAVAVVAFPAGSLSTPAGKASEYPVYLSVHSSDTGECPVGQNVLYLTTLSTPDSRQLLEEALEAFVGTAGEGQPAQILIQIRYEQLAGSGSFQPEGPVITFPSPSFSLSFDDSVLEPVQQAWKRIMGDAAAESDYMSFADREGAMDDDDVYE